jgi:hypothetical protein
MSRVSLLLAAALLFGTSDAMAQTLALDIKEGRVTLDAQNVSVRQILDRWAEVGGVTILNADKVSTKPVTLLLTGVPEREALDTLLRGVSGYILGARQQPGAAGTLIDRIVLVTSTPPLNAALPASPPRGVAAVDRIPTLFNTSIDTPNEVYEPLPEAVHDDDVAVFQSTDAAPQQPRRNTPPPPPDPNARPASMPIRYLDALDENGQRLRAPTEEFSNQPPVPAVPDAPPQGAETGSGAGRPRVPFTSTSGTATPGIVSPVKK